MYIDTHCHLDNNEYSNVDEIIEKMENNIMIASGSDSTSNNEVIQLINSKKNIYGMIGIHPNCITENIENDLEYIEKNISNKKIVAVGEIGLDYHYDDFDKNLQKKYFIKQINLANKYNKAIVVHSRDAFEDTYNIIKEYCNDKNKITFHCYSYSSESALKLQQLGVKFGISGVVTFKNSKKLKDVIEKIDIKNILSETDSPYLTPEPHRGKRNEPYNVRYVVEAISKIKNMEKEEVEQILFQNALNQYDIEL